MNVIQKLETRIRQINRNLSVEMPGKKYNWAQADERDLLELAVRHIRNAEQSSWDAYHVGVADGRRGLGPTRRPQ